MVKEVILPKLDLDQENGTVARWLKHEGEHVERGEALMEVESDKVVMECNAEATGTLLKILVSEGISVPVTTVVAFIGDPGDVLPPGGSSGVGEPAAEPPTERVTSAEGHERVMTPLARRMADANRVDVVRIEGTGPGGKLTAADIRTKLLPNEETKPRGRVRASPAARHLAREARISLGEVNGTGPAGEITAADIRKLAAGGQTAPGARSPSLLEGSPLVGLRATIAERMTATAQNVPQVTLHSEVDGTELVRVRTQCDRPDRRISYNAILVLIVGKALKVMPDVNVQLREGRLLHIDEINVGVAVDTDRGLVVPVVHDVDKKSLDEVSAELGSLAERAMAGKATRDDLTGGTFTITNLGTYGVGAFTPIVNAPESAILGVGELRDRACVVGGTIQSRPTMSLSLTFDHRVFDGAFAARFLRKICELVETPYTLLLLK